MAETGCPENSTGMSQFLLLGFNSLPALKPFLFVFFLTIYLLTVAGNLLILVTVISDTRLHLPMYFFLGNLAIMEMFCTTTVISTLLGSHLGQGLGLPHYGCMMQLTVFTWFTMTECFLLAVMAYDRYVAICHPLHYSTLMGQQLCLHLAFCTWVISFLISITNTISLNLLQFPSHVPIDHFMCDFSPFLKGACSDTSKKKMECFVFAFVVLSAPFTSVIVSYVYIIATIMKIPSTKGKSKTFSTCSSHLTIVITYFVILTIMYMVPSARETHTANKAFSLLYTVGTPLFNPIVYTLRNKKMKEALAKFLSRICQAMSALYTSEMCCQNHKSLTLCGKMGLQNAEIHNQTIALTQMPDMGKLAIIESTFS